MPLLSNMSLEQIPYLSAEDAEAMLNGPALEPPEGVVPNYENRSTALEVLYASLSLVLLVAISAAGLRAYSRIYVVKKVRIEDGKYSVRPPVVIASTDQSLVLGLGALVRG